MKKKIIALCLTAVLALSLFAGCAGEKETASKEIILANTYAISEFHPASTPEHTTDNNYMYFAANFYNTLIRYENGGYAPELAESWKISEDGLVYTFVLQKDVKFSDGEAMNAEAVKKSLESIPVRLGQYNGSFGRTSALFDKIVAVDEHTVEVHLTTPYYGALKDFSMVSPMAIVSPSCINDDGTVKADTKTKTFGTGPYMYTGTNDGTTFTFEQNPTYWGEKPEVDSFKIMVIADNDAKILALRNGEIDAIIGADKISFDAYSEMSSADGFAALRSSTTNTTRFIGFNTLKAPFSDAAVRQAASHAIDKATISEGLFDGLEEKTDNLLDKSLPFCDVDVPAYAFDIEKAKSILEEAGWIDADGDGIREKDGVRLAGDAVYTTGSAMMDELVQTIAAQLKAVGIEINIRGVDMMTYYQHIMEGTWSLAVTSTYGSIFDPCTAIANIDPRMPMDPVSNGFLAPSGNGEALLDELNSATDDAAVTEAYRKILTGIAENASCAPLSYTKELIVYNSNKIAGYTFTDNPVLVYVDKIDLK